MTLYPKYKRSEFAEKALMLNGKPMSLDDYFFFRTIYNSYHPSIVLQTSRQVAKSTTLAAESVINSSLYPYFKTLYVSPSVDQTKIFSNDRVSPFIQKSPYIKKHFINSKDNQNVFTKKFNNGSKIFLRYAGLSADRLRGISSDANFFDECYSKNTQVLTNEGWVNFNDLTENNYDDYEYATSNGEYQKPSRLVKRKHEGKMLKFSKKDFSISVTPNHNMYAKQSNGDWKLTKAKFLIDEDFAFKIGSKETPIDDIEEIDYNDNVYCVTVPNSTLVVRDKEEKTPVVCGNCQDLREDIIPIVNKTYSRSKFKWNLYSGTPKTSTTTLAKLWRGSTQNEWAVKCHHKGCKEWNVPLNQNNIGKEGTICKHCGKPLEIKNGTWVRTGSKDSNHQGFRVSMLMFDKAPWVNWDRDILQFREEHSEAVFFNEALGIEYDSGVKPVTKEELRKCCNNDYSLEEDPTDITLSKPTYLGLDYGPVNSNKSNTLAVVLQNHGDKVRVVWAKRYTGPEASYSFIHEDIPRIVNKFRVSLVGSDYGLGEAPNSEIRKKIGYDKLIAYQHVPNQKARSQFNQKMPAFTLSRSKVMTELFEKLKHRKIIFPKWDEIEPFAQEILNISKEADTDRGRIKYTNDRPDDFFQALLYGTETAVRHKKATSPSF